MIVSRAVDRGVQEVAGGGGIVDVEPPCMERWRRRSMR